MELALVKFFSQLFLSSGAEFLDLQHTNFVGTCLARRDDVTFYFRFNLFLAHPGFLAHVSDRLFASPMLCVNSGINHQSYCAEKLVTKASQVSKWIVVVPPGLFCQPLAVKRPAFHVRGKR